VRKADNLPPSCAVVMKSGNLNFLETSGPVQAYNGTDLRLHFTVHTKLKILDKINVKYSLVSVMQACRKVKVYVHLALDGIEWSASHPGHLSPE